MIIIWGGGLIEVWWVSHFGMRYGIMLD